MNSTYAFFVLLGMLLMLGIQAVWEALLERDS